MAFEYVKTNLANIITGDVGIVVSNKEENNFALGNDKGTSSAPLAYSVTVVNDVIDESQAASNILWEATNNNGVLQFKLYEGSTRLYCTSSNNGVRVGTNSANTFTISPEGYLKHVGTSRYLGVYNGSDWRCYTSINSNISGQTFAFYKKQEVIVYHDVSFDANGGTGSMPTIPVQDNTTYNLPVNGFIAPEGYEFKCWEVDGEERAVGYPLLVTADTTVTAVWQEYIPPEPSASSSFNSISLNNNILSVNGVDYALEVTEVESGEIPQEDRSFREISAVNNGDNTITITVDGKSITVEEYI